MRSPEHGNRNAWIEEGVRLARERREALADLARRDPSRALAHVMSLRELAALPEPVRDACEAPWSAIGSLDLQWSATEMDDGSIDCRHRHVVHAKGESWLAFSPEWLAPQAPRLNLPMLGYLLGDVLLVHPESAWPLAGDEVASAELWFPRSGGTDPLTGAVPEQPVHAVVGGRIHAFESRDSIRMMDQAIAAADREATQGKRRELNHGLAFLAGDTGGDFPSPVEPSPFMSDEINVLFIRVDFSDFPGAPIGHGDLSATLDTVASYVDRYSYGAASLVHTVTAFHYRMPSTGASYAVAGNDSGLLADARALAQADGYQLSDYQVVAVYFPSLGGVEGSQITYGGLASIGGGNHWINGSNNVNIILHEFGHNYGLYHANYWHPARQLGGQYGGPASGSLEYGDLFDNMGGSPAATGHFNPYTLHRLEWLPSSKVVTPAVSGTWRIHRFDSPGALSNGTLALRVPMGGDVFYWVGHRKLFTSGTYNLSNAAYVVAEGLYENRSNLIDMTPGSGATASLDRNDAGLPVGGEYREAGIRLETLASGGTAPNEWIDVRVTFDPKIGFATPFMGVDEQAGMAFVTLRRSFDSTDEISVDYATVDGTATAGSDYHPVSGTITWAAGDMADKTISVAIVPDAIDEGAESFTVELSNLSAGMFESGIGSAEISILDPGRRFIQFTPGFFDTPVEDLIALPDGGAIIGGTIGSGIGSHSRIRHIARLNSDGSVDTGFLTGSGFNGPVRALARQSGGKILVGGDNFTEYDGALCNRLVRLNADGKLDTAFQAALGTGPNGAVLSIAVEADGSILVGGAFTGFSGHTVKRMIRLAPGGTPQPLNLDDSLSATRIEAILPQSDGKIMIAGLFFYNISGSLRYGVARLNADGSRDGSFDPTDGAHFDTFGLVATVGDIVRDSQGRYVIGGNFNRYNNQPAPRIARVLADGAFDPSFVPPAYGAATINSLLIQASGKIVVGAGSTMAGVEAMYLTRLNPDGSLDATFDPEGPPSRPGVRVVREDAEGALWVGGHFLNYGGAASRPVVRVAGGVGVYERWATGWFSHEQFVAGGAGAGADPDGDGFDNLTEMAMGGHPLVFTAGQGLQANAGPGEVVERQGGRFLQLSLEKSDSGGQLWYGAQFSDDLQSWLPLHPVPGGNVIYEVIEDAAGRIVVRDRTPVGDAPRRFGRIVVRRPE